MKKIFLTAIIGVFSFAVIEKATSPTHARAMQESSSAPTAEQILDKYVSALGGQSAIEKLTTRVMKGTAQMTSTGEMGTIEIYKKAPDKELYNLIIPSNGPMPRAYNGKTGWVEYDPDEGPKDAAESDLRGMQREFAFYRELRLKALYPKLTVQPTEKVSGEDAYVIQAVANDGSTERWYFSAKSGVLLRCDTPYVTDDGTSFLQTLYEDYRDVDGIKIPYVWRQTSPDFDYLITFTQIQNNVPIDDSKFDKPSAH